MRKTMMKNLDVFITVKNGETKRYKINAPTIVKLLAKRASEDFQSVDPLTLTDEAGYELDPSQPLISQVESDEKNKIKLQAISKEKHSEAFKHMTVSRILDRNVKECINNAKNNPLTRKRHSKQDPEASPLEKRPKTETFIEDTKALAETLSQFAESMKTMANNLEKSIDSGREQQTAAWSIQNNMDAVRYIIPILQSMTKIVIPNTWNKSDELMISQSTSRPSSQNPRPASQNFEENQILKGKNQDSDSIRTVL